MNVNNKREDPLEVTEAVIDEGIDPWANDHPAGGTGEPVTGRVQQHAQIMRDREEYHDLYRSSSSRFGEIINEAVKDKDLQRMTGALLYLAAAGYKDRKLKSDPVGVWEFDPETGERTVVRDPEQLPVDEPGIEPLGDAPDHTEVAVVK